MLRGGASGANDAASGGTMNQQSLSAFIWSVADLLRGDYKPADYGKVILPFTVLRRLDCVLAPTKAEVLAEFEARTKVGLNPEPFLKRKAEQTFFNTSPMDLKKLLGDPANVGPNLLSYLQAFSPEVRDIFERFEFANQVDKLAKAKLLFMVAEKFAGIDLHPDRVSNSQMGLVFEELIRKFAEASNETAGDHFTPREVIRLMVNLLFVEDDDILTKAGVVRSIYDPTAGTGGMLSVAEEHLRALNPDAQLTMSGQELNPESYAICKADMLIKGQDVSNIVFGNTLSEDGHFGRKFDYLLANPPYGVDWKKVEREVRAEHQRGFAGRFGPGLPRVGDGALLFLLHMLSKMRPAAEGGCRFAVVLNGSSLFSGAAGSGESEVRRYLLENDLVEAIVALPNEMFFNTPIGTYIWVVSNRKPVSRRGAIQLIDGTSFWTKLRKPLGDKRKELSAKAIDELTALFGRNQNAELVTMLGDDGGELARHVAFETEALPPLPKGASSRRVPVSRVVSNGHFAYQTITIERPLRDSANNVVVNQKGRLKGLPQADPGRRETAAIPAAEDVDEWLRRAVLPTRADAWVDKTKTKIGCEISFLKEFFVFDPPRELDQIDSDLAQVTASLRQALDAESHNVVVAPFWPVAASASDTYGRGWLSATPEHWERVPLGSLLTPRRLIVGADSANFTLLSLTTRGIVPRNIDGGEGKFPTSFDSYQVVEPGDLVFCRFDVDETPRTVGLSTHYGMITGAYDVFIPEDLNIGQFVYYTFLMHDSFKSLKPFYSGLRKVIRTEVFNSIEISLPPRFEIPSIIRGLQDHVSSFERLVDQAEQAISLIGERQKTLIAQAITGKVDVRGTAAPPTDLRLA